MPAPNPKGPPTVPRYTAALLLLLAACTPAGAADGPPTTVSFLETRVAEADYLDYIADLTGMDKVDRFTDPHGLLDSFLDDAYDHCYGLDRADPRNRYLVEHLGDEDISGITTRVVEAAVTYLCPRHKDLLG